MNWPSRWDCLVENADSKLLRIKGIDLVAHRSSLENRPIACGGFCYWEKGNVWMLGSGDAASLINQFTAMKARD